MSELSDLRQEVAGLKRIIANLMKPGVVSHVDPAKSRARMKFGGADDKPTLSAWSPYSQMAGGTKAHVPLTVGQQVMMFCPNGDPAQGLLVPMTFTTDNASPGTKGDENAVSFGKTVITGDIDITGKVTIAGDFKASGGAFEHDGKNVGATHKHIDVQRGTDVTGPPQG